MGIPPMGVPPMMPGMPMMPPMMPGYPVPGFPHVPGFPPGTLMPGKTFVLLYSYVIAQITGMLGVTGPFWKVK